jgi:hypothetical protein
MSADMASLDLLLLQNSLEHPQDVFARLAQLFIDELDATFEVVDVSEDTTRAKQPLALRQPVACETGVVEV